MEKKSSFPKSKFFTKIARAMKISIFLFLISMQLSAKNYAQQKISLSSDRADIQTVFKLIEKQSVYRFFYSNDVLLATKEVTVQFKDAELGEVLNKVLDGLAVKWKLLDNKNIVISNLSDKGNYLNTANASYADSVIVGFVKTSEEGTPLKGVTVLLKGTNTKTTTDDNGRYQIRVPSSSAVLIFSYVGYLNKELVINKSNLQDVTLKVNTKALDEVVVVGYGKQNRREVTGAIVSISETQLKEIAVSSFENAIQGKVAGLEVSVPSGEPGSAPVIRIRGSASISAGNDPLYVIDGLPISSNSGLQQNIGQRTEAYTVPRINPFTTINPNDIQSIEVLKDASAAGIYGSRGSNGVIMVTTKKGVKNKRQISFNAYTGFNEATNLPKLMESEELIQYTKEARNNNYLQTNDPTNPASKTYNPLYNANSNAGRGTTASFLIPEKYLNWDGTNTDWLSLVLSRGMVSNYNLSVSGGKENLTYYTSAGYYTEEGSIKGSKFDRYTFRANVVDDITSKLQVGSSINIAFTDNNRLPANGPYFALPPGIIYDAMVHSPLIKPYLADGSINQSDNQNQLGAYMTTANNPLATMAAIKENIKNLRVFGNTYLKYTILPDLSVKTYLGIDIDSYQQSYYKGVTLLYRGATKPDPFAKSSTSQGLNWIWENTLDYSKSFNDHKLTLLAGYTAQKQNNDLQFIQANSFPDDQVQTISGGIVTGGSATKEQWSLASALARVNYAYNEKYLLSALIRSDKSSRFGIGNQTGVFPSVSAGWRIDQEDFMTSLDFVNELKIRTSYGLTGNFQIPNYGSIGLLNNSNYVFGNAITSGIGRATLNNDKLSWESKKQLDIGIDFGLFNDRIYGGFDYYNSITSDLLLNVNIASSAGFTTALTNIGEVENKGVEFTLSTRNIIGKFQWSTDFNISANRNKVLKLGPTGDPILSVGSAGDIRHITRIGDPVGSYYGYQVVGVYQHMEEIAAAPKDLLVGTGGARPGDLQFKDVNGDGVISPLDRTVLGNYMPDFTYGITNKFRYKNLDLSVFIQGVEGREILNLTQRHLLNGEANFNSYAEYRNRWVSVEQPGNGKIPRGDSNSGLHGYNMRPSSFQVEDGSYVRLRNITLGYEFPIPRVSKKVRVYLTGTNLFIWSKYLGFNPEVQQQATNNLVPGEDYGAYPVSRTFLLGFNLTF
jgi:TonB-linked SusC/RagA family outer membrane protein